VAPGAADVQQVLTHRVLPSSRRRCGQGISRISILPRTPDPPYALAHSRPSESSVSGRIRYSGPEIDKRGDAGASRVEHRRGDRDQPSSSSATAVA
jgi:hypothetical protein